MNRALAAGSLVALVLTLAGCGSADDVLGDAARSAGCTAANQVVSPIRDQARSAVEDLGVDPAAARRKLDALRSAVTATLPAVDGETRAALQEIRDALGTLSDQARTTTRGAVDQQAVREAQAELDTAITGFTTVC